jgi:hypothetical protein
MLMKWLFLPKQQVVDLLGNSGGNPTGTRMDARGRYGRKLQ